MDDASSVFDASILTGPVANFPVADSFNRRARTRLFDRRHPARLRRVRGVGPAVRRRPARRAGGVVGALVERLDAERRAHAAVGHAGGGDADDQQQCVRRLRHAAAESGRRPDTSRRRSSVSRWFNTSAFAAAPAFTIGTSSRNPVRGPGYRNLDLALMRRVPLSGARRWNCAPKSSTPPTRRRSARRTPRSVRRRSGRSPPRRSARRATGAEVPILNGRFATGSAPVLLRQKPDAT